MDIPQINEVLGLASSAVGITGKAASTIATFKKLFEGDKAPDKEEAAQLMNQLAFQLTTANVMNVQLSDALKTLSRELQRQDEFEQEKARYELFQTGERDFVFKLKAEMANELPSHFICPVCLNRDKLISYISGEGDYKTCQTDNSHMYKFRNTPIRQTTYDTGLW